MNPDLKKPLGMYLANVVRHKGVEDALRIGRAGSSGGGGGGCACGTCGKVLLEAAEIIHTPTPPLLRLDDVLDVALVERVRPADDGHGGEPLVDANQVFSGKQKEGEGDGENCEEREGGRRKHRFRNSKNPGQYSRALLTDCIGSHQKDGGGVAD